MFLDDPMLLTLTSVFNVEFLPLKSYELVVNLIDSFFGTIKYLRERAIERKSLWFIMGKKDFFEN